MIPLIAVRRASAWLREGGRGRTVQHQREGEIKGAARMRAMSLLLFCISPAAAIGTVPPRRPTPCFHVGFTVPRAFTRALCHE